MTPLNFVSFNLAFGLSQQSVSIHIMISWKKHVLNLQQNLKYTHNKSLKT